MRILFFSVATLLLLLLGCKPTQSLISFPLEEERTMDTIFVSANELDIESPELLDETGEEEQIAATNYELPAFNASQTRTHDLLHTKLEVSFNWEKATSEWKSLFEDEATFLCY
ncbi:MAG: hypothetical protein HC892_13025 [Saprospiraceae bacterium]|nr:hypothetical protein [Saprospiraceae bacterium]